jgi:hypothetical protein
MKFFPLALWYERLGVVYFVFLLRAMGCCKPPHITEDFIPSS